MMFATPERYELIAQSIEKLGTLFAAENYVTRKKHYDGIRDLMLAYPDSSAAALHEHIMADLTKEPDEYVARNLFLSMIIKPNHKETSATVHEYLIFKESLPFTLTAPDEAMATVRALHSYQQLPLMEDYTEADDDTKAKIIALLTVTNSLYAKYKQQEYGMLVSAASSWTKLPTIPPPVELGLPLEVKPEIRLLGDGLINLIIDCPDDAHEIARRISEEGIADSSLLREIFESDTPSLRDGLI